MGTNYYLHSQVQPPCPCCQRPYEDEPLHIGKSSAGWCFSLHVIPDMGLNTLEDWQRRWVDLDVMIRDECGDPIEPGRMTEIVCDRTGSRSVNHPAWYAQNSAVPGPKGLARHAVDGVHCIGHGAGTWDLIAGEFS